MSLETVIKAFSAVGLVETSDRRIGIQSDLLDALMDAPGIALEIRRAGFRLPIPGVTDCPASRLVLDRIAHDDEAIAQSAALLDGETDSIILSAPILFGLLPHVPELSASAIAALHEPTDLHRRARIRRWLDAAIACGRLPFVVMHFQTLVDRQNYADFEPLPGSPFLVAWLAANPE